MFAIDRRVVVVLLLRGCGRQADEMRCAVLPAPVQKRRAAKRDGKAFRARSEQHRQHPEEHVVADDDVGREAPQHLLQALVLGRKGVDEHALQCDAQPVRPRSHALQLGSHRADVTQIEVRALGKGVEFRPDGFDAAAQNAARQKGEFVAFGDQDASDREQRIEMARRGGRSDENFHVTCYSGCRMSGPPGQLSDGSAQGEAGWGIAVTPRLRRGAKWLRLQWVMALRRRDVSRPQIVTAIRSAGRASNR